MRKPKPTQTKRVSTGAVGSSRVGQHGQGVPLGKGAPDNIKIPRLNTKHVESTVWSMRHTMQASVKEERATSMQSNVQARSNLHKPGGLFGKAGLSESPSTGANSTRSVKGTGRAQMLTNLARASGTRSVAEPKSDGRQFRRNSIFDNQDPGFDSSRSGMRVRGAGPSISAYQRLHCCKLHPVLTCRPGHFVP